MVMDKKIKPFLNIGPGYTLKKYLDARGWTQEDLANITDISTKQLSQIVNDKVRITIDTARLLANAFGTSPEFWINLDTKYRLNLDNDTTKETDTQKKAKIRKYMPFSEIVKKGWYNYDNSSEGYESLFKAIWEKDNIDTEIYERPQEKYCARQKRDNEEFTSFYSLTWQQVARKKSENIKVPFYCKEKLVEIAENFTNYTYSNDGILNVVQDLNGAGIKFFILSHLSKTYLDGACFWDKENPVIVYTGRYDRVDNFWFTLAHEIAHVLLHLPYIKNKSFLDDLNDGEVNSDQEIEADQKAESILHVDDILTKSKPFLQYFSEAKLNLISSQLEIEQSVILGILQHKRLVEYRKLNKYKKKVLEKFPKEIVLG